MSQQPPDSSPPNGWQSQSPGQYPQGYSPPQPGQWQPPPAYYYQGPAPVQPPRNDKIGPLPLWAWGVITFVGVVLIAAIAGTLSNPSYAPRVVAAVTPTTLVRGGQVVADATATPQPTPVPSATPIPIILTTEWAVVKSTGAEVKTAPDPGANTMEKLGSFTVVAMQRKLQTGVWYERAGGGWLARNDLTIYGSEAEARRAAPQPTRTPTPIPTYNPNQQPTAAPAVVQPQVVVTATAPAAAIPVAKPAATPTSKPTATVATAPTSVPAPAQAPAKPRGVTDASSPCLEGQIKGNRNSGIYHVPSGRDYAKTKANVQCFDTTAQAEAAGFRASKV